MEQKAPGRYYTPSQVLVGTILGGPLAGGFFLAGDHSAFGAPGRGRAALMISCLVIVGTVLLQGGPDKLEMGDALLLAGFVAGLYGVYARLALTAEIARRHTAGWLPHSWARVIGIALAFCVAGLLLIALAAPNLGGPA